MFSHLIKAYLIHFFYLEVKLQGFCQFVFEGRHSWVDFEESFKFG